MQSYYQSPLMFKTLGDQGEFSGYLSVKNTIDDHGDQISDGAFTSTLRTWRKKKKWPPFLWQHQAEYPIGFFTEMREDHKGLYVKGKILIDLPKAKEAYIMLKNGAIDGLSIGFIPKKMRRIGDIRQITEIDLKEGSLVSIGANFEASVEECKAYHALNSDKLEDLLNSISRLKYKLLR